MPKRLPPEGADVVAVPAVLPKSEGGAAAVVVGAVVVGAELAAAPEPDGFVDGPEGGGPLAAPPIEGKPAPKSPVGATTEVLAGAPTPDDGPVDEEVVGGVKALPPNNWDVWAAGAEEVGGVGVEPPNSEPVGAFGGSAALLLKLKGVLDGAVEAGGAGVVDWAVAAGLAAKRPPVAGVDGFASKSFEDLADWAAPANMPPGVAPDAGAAAAGVVEPNSGFPP